VREDDAELELELPARELGCELENEAEAAADVKDDSAVGASGSGATVLSMVSQWSSTTGLMLRSRSPSPSRVVAGLQDSRRELEGSGPSAMVRRPILRSGGKPTALLSLLSSSPSSTTTNVSCRWVSSLGTSGLSEPGLK
jgi:hypothetical protein